MPKADPDFVQREIDDHRGMFCMCGAVPIEGASLCWHCKTYFDDVAEGLYDEPWDIEEEIAA